MATFAEDFTNFIAWRRESMGESVEEKKTRAELADIPDSIMERVNGLCSATENAAYRLGFRDALLIMAGM